MNRSNRGINANLSQNLDQDQHDSCLRLGTNEPATGRSRALRLLDDHDLPGSLALHRLGVALLVIDGAVNSEMFRAWIGLHLVKELRLGDIVVMDNLSSLKVVGVREAIECVGASLVYLSPYSPDLNLIEQVFSKIKNAESGGGGQFGVSHDSGVHEPTQVAW